MTSIELAAALDGWLNGTSAALRLEIDDGPVALIRHAAEVVCGAAIMLPTAADEALFSRALALADAARRQYGEEAATLSLSAQDERLWLWMKPEPDDVLQLCRCLETLLNQRDVWQGVIARAPVSEALSLNTLTFLQGEQHA